MHLYVNNSEADIHLWIDSALRGKHASREIRMYVCIYITSFMSAKLFMSSDPLGRGAPSSSGLPPSHFHKDAAALRTPALFGSIRSDTRSVKLFNYVS